MAIDEKKKEEAENLIKKHLRIEECYPIIIKVLKIPHEIDSKFSHTLKDRCPSKHHNDALPSFSISKDKQFANCFGCSFGANGVLDLYVKLNREYNNPNYTYLQGIYDVAKQFNVKIPKFTYDPHKFLRNNLSMDTTFEISSEAKHNFTILKLKRKLERCEVQLKELSINDYYKYLFLRVQYLNYNIESLQDYVAELEEVISQCQRDC